MGLDIPMEETKSGTVWIVHRQDQMDYSSAQVYGELRSMFTGPDCASWWKPDLIEALRDIVLSSMSPEDWLIVTGDPVAIAVVCSLMGAEGFEELRLLKWDRKERAYHPFIISLKEKEDVGNA